jgi:hypothetical protein
VQPIIYAKALFSRLRQQMRDPGKRDHTKAWPKHIRVRRWSLQIVRFLAIERLKVHGDLRFRPA